MSKEEQEVLDAILEKHYDNMKEICFPPLRAGFLEDIELAIQLGVGTPVCEVEEYEIEDDSEE